MRIVSDASLCICVWKRSEDPSGQIMYDKVVYVIKSSIIIVDWYYTKVKLLLNKNDKKLIFSDWDGSKKIKTYVSYSQWQNQIQRVRWDCLQKDLKDKEIDKEKIEKFNLHGFMKPEMNYFVWWKGTKSNLQKKSRKVGMKERWSRPGRKNNLHRLWR